jgi:hypothetical protein
MARLKKKLNDAPDQYLTTRPVSKQSTLEDMFSQSKKPRKEEYDIVPNPNKKKESVNKKKKMSLDSDE